MPAGSRRGAFDLNNRTNEFPEKPPATGGFFVAGPPKPKTEEMLKSTDDLRIRDIQELRTPAEVMHEFPRTDTATRTVLASRHALHNILHGSDDRLAVVVGPCSIHDPAAALDYARRLLVVRERLGDRLEIVMRVYFEKPRTTVGWKGLINDPELDGSFQIDNGLRIARSLLRDIADLGLPAGCEFLDMATPQYFADQVAWGAIGARTTESQVHRELASGLSCPVGFKNGTDGNVRIALDAVKSASQPHHSSPSPRTAARPSPRPPAMTTATSSCAAAKRRILTPKASRPPRPTPQNPASARPS